MRGFLFSLHVGDKGIVTRVRASIAFGGAAGYAPASFAEQSLGVVA
jgi:hypothetical protein